MQHEKAIKNRIRELEAWRIHLNKEIAKYAPGVERLIHLKANATYALQELEWVLGGPPNEDSLRT